MNLIRLLQPDIKPHKEKLFFYTVITGLANILLIDTIHSAAENIANNELNHQYLIRYVIFVGLFVFIRKYILDHACEIIETAVLKCRHRLGNKIRHTELETLESVGVPSIYVRLTQDVTDISYNGVWVILTAQSAFTICFMLIYMAVLSLGAFLLVFLGIAVGIISYIRYNDVYLDNLKKLSLKEEKFVENFNHLIKGFKEIRINKKKNDGVFKNYAKVNASKKSIRVDTTKLYYANMAYSQLFFYATMAAIVFVLPIYNAAHSDIIIKIIGIIFFLIGPLEAILAATVNVAIVENAAYNILSLEKKLDKELKNQNRQWAKNNKKRSISPLIFEKSIELKGLIYEYNKNNPAHAFKIGPMNLKVNKGEIIFITGSNGSGKSTFLKMFTGLYIPKRGNIYLDRDVQNGASGLLINPSNYEQYRELFTLIFTDFHLFDKLYGLKNINETQINQLLLEMDLPPEKTRFKKGRFTNIKLSSGQKKRLALITSILEDKEIYIFDEVASDLDPEFRDTYYYKILPELKSRNKTVFVVSHDKSYWDVADRVVELKKGQFHEKLQIEQFSEVSPKKYMP